MFYKIVLAFLLTVFLTFGGSKFGPLSNSAFAVTADEGGDGSEHSTNSHITKARSTPKVSSPKPQQKVQKRRIKPKRRVVRRKQRKSRRVARKPVSDPLIKENGLPSPGETRFLKDQIIVRYAPGSPRGQLNRLVQRLGMNHLEAKTFFLAGYTAHRYSVRSGRPILEIIAELSRSPHVVIAQPNYVYELQANAESAPTPNYALTRMSIGTAHETSRGASVKIAIIDSMIDKSHPELASTDIIVHDLRDEDQLKPDGHGTSIAGIIGAQKTLTGVAPQARILGISAFGKSVDGRTTGNSWVVAKAMDLADNRGARVFNLSFAGPQDPVIEHSLSGASRKGILSIAAAGNAGPESSPLYPAAYTNVIGVAATDSKDFIYSNSNRGKYIAVAAPGVEILTPALNGSYGISSGTSLSAAYVSGITALLLSAKPDLTRGMVQRLLFGSATDLGSPGRDDIFGEGIPNAAKALQAAGAL